MIEFKKKELDFLYLYNLCKGNKHEQSDKFYMRKIGNNIVFIALTDKVSLFTVLEKEMDESEFYMILPILEFYKMLSFCKDDDSIIFNDKNIQFGESSSYSFENYPHLSTLYDTDIVFNIIDNIQSFKSVDLKEISKLTHISSYIGNDDFDIFSFQSYYFVTNNGKYITAANKTNNSALNLWLPSIFHTIIKTLKLDELNILIDESSERFIYTYNNTFFTSPFVDPIIYNIFDEDNKKYYEHSNKIIIKKDDLIDSIKRISVVTNNLQDNNLFIKFEDNKIIFENMLGVQGKEIISNTIPPVLKGQLMCVHSDSLVKIIDSLDDTIIIRLPDNLENASVIKIEDNKEEKFYVLNLMEK